MNIILSRYNVVVLDFDGTILDSSGLWQQAYLDWCSQTGYDPIHSSPDNYEEWTGLLYKAHGIQISESSFRNKLRGIALKLYAKTPPRFEFDRFVETCTESGIQIMIVSREDEGFVKAYLESFEIEGVEEIVQDKGDMRSQGVFYRQLSSSRNCDTESVVLVDDSLSHCIAAKNAGATVVGINDGHSPERIADMKKVCDLYSDDFRWALH